MQNLGEEKKVKNQKVKILYYLLSVDVLRLKADAQTMPSVAAINKIRV